MYPYEAGAKNKSAVHILGIMRIRLYDGPWAPSMRNRGVLVEEFRKCMEIREQVRQQEGRIEQQGEVPKQLHGTPIKSRIILLNGYYATKAMPPLLSSHE